MDLQSPVHASAAPVGGIDGLGGDRASRREKTSGWCGRVWWCIPSPAVRSLTARHGGFLADGRANSGTGDVHGKNLGEKIGGG